MKHRIGLLLLCLALSAAALAQEPKIWKFDAGPAKSPLWPGFQPLTAKDIYSPEKGFGWSSRSQIVDAKNYQPDDLCRDLVVAKSRYPLEFHLKLPNGKYHVSVISGDDLTAGGDYFRGMHLMQTYRILAEGKEAARVKRDFFELQDRDYVPGESIYDKYIANRYIQSAFPVEVTDGVLDLVFEGLIGERKDFAVPINCIMVYPDAERARMKRDLAEIESKRREAFLARWTELKAPVEPAPPLRVDDEAKRLGYVTFRRNYLKFVFPQTLPMPSEYGDTIELFATPGEWEPATFCIRPIKDLKGVTVTVSDLKSKDGIIASANIRVNVIKYQEMANPSRNYTVLPYTLMDGWKKIDIPRDLTKQYWLKTWAPKDAKPGIYTGAVTIQPENAPAKTLALRLRVLPFKLRRRKGASWFYFGTRRRRYWDLHDRKKDEGYYEMYRKEAENLREHGFCLSGSIRPPYSGIKVDKEQKKLLSIDFTEMDEDLAFRKKLGALPPDGFLTFTCGGIARAWCGAQWIQQRIPKPKKYVFFSDKKEDQDLFIAIVKAIDKHVRKKGWGTPVFECGGELTNYGEQGLTYGRRAYGCLRRAGVLTALRGNGPVDYQIIQDGLVDYPIPNIALIRDEWTDYMKRHCKGMWLYNYSNGRYGFGWFAWKKGGTRTLHEGYICNDGRPWDDFDAGSHNWHVGVEATRDGVVSRITFEHMAEGRDDYDYINTLECLIKEAKASGKPAAAEAAKHAQATLDWIGERCFTDYDFRGNRESASGLYRDAGCNWPPGDFDKYRWMVAREIMNLQKAME
ncbi:MAG: hypothetical protein GXP25_03320 [Planctomycetes bacterium]|nr:hypothetical protein [Planctomycetota bacterium]